MPKPITPTTPILEEVYDPYGNRSGGNRKTAEEREAELNAVNDYLNVNDDGMTLNKYFDLSPKDRADLDDKAAKASPIRYTIGEVVKLAAPGRFLAQGLDAFGNAIKGMFPKPVELPSDPFSYYKHTKFGSAPDLKNPYGSENFPEARITAPPEGTVGSDAPQGDPAQQAQAFERNSPPGRLGPDAGANAAPPGGPPSGGGGRSGDGPNGPAGRGEPGGDRGGWGRGGGYAHGGIANLYNLGSYSDGGRLLKGPGNGTSDDIPAIIGHNQPARLAEGEFVIPARIVSELGNGSTDAGAKQLYAMMDRIQKSRAKTVGKNKVAFDAKARNHLPA
jgi:hypothetical protein